MISKSKMERRYGATLKVGTVVEDKNTGKIGKLTNLYFKSSYPYEVEFEDGTTERYTLFGDTSEKNTECLMLFPEYRDSKRKVMLLYGGCYWLGEGKFKCSNCTMISEEEKEQCYEPLISEVASEHILIDYKIEYKIWKKLYEF